MLSILLVQMLVCSAFASEEACSNEACDDETVLLQAKVDTAKAFNDAVVVEDEPQLFAFMQQVVNDGAPWVVNPSAYSNTATMTFKVTIDGTQMGEGTLAAFVGSQVRGVAPPPSLPIPFGPNKGTKLYLMTTYADSGGESMTFKYWLNGKIIDLSPAITFVVNQNLGNLFWAKELTGSLPTSLLPPPSPLSATSPPSPPWTIDKHLYPDSATLTARVIVGGTTQSQGELAAFKGTEIVGLEDETLTPTAPFPPGVRKPAFFLMIYGNTDGVAINFKFKSETGTITTLHACGTSGTEETYTWATGHKDGNIFNPYVFKDVAC